MATEWRKDVDKGTGDAKALGETAQAFQTRYADSVWAKKASV